MSSLMPEIQDLDPDGQRLPIKLDALAADELRKFTERDKVAQSKAEYSGRPNPAYLTYGPRTRREFLNLRAWDAGEP